MTSTKFRYTINFFLFYSLYAIVVPYFQLFLYGKGLTPSSTGLVIGMWEIAGIVGPLLLGALTDRTGRFRIILLTALGSSVLALFSLIPVEPLPLIMVLAGIFGFMFKPILSINDSMISHNLPDPEHDYGHVRVAGSIGFAAIMLTFEITGIFNTPTPSMIARASLILGFMYGISILFLPAGEIRPPRPKMELPGRGLPFSQARTDFPEAFFILILGTLTARIGFTGHYSFFSIFLQEELHVKNVGVYWMIAAAAEVIPIMFGGKLVRRLGRRNALLAGIAAMAVRMIIYSISHSLIVIGVSQLLHSMTFGLAHAASIGYINERIRSVRKTLAMSLYAAIGWGLAAFIGSPIGGLLIESFGYRGMYRSMTLFPLAAMAMIIGYDIAARKSGWERLD